MIERGATLEAPQRGLQLVERARVGEPFAHLGEPAAVAQPGDSRDPGADEFPVERVGGFDLNPLALRAHGDERLPFERFEHVLFGQVDERVEAQPAGERQQFDDIALTLVEVGQASGDEFLKQRIRHQRSDEAPQPGTALHGPAGDRAIDKLAQIQHVAGADLDKACHRCAVNGAAERLLEQPAHRVGRQRPQRQPLDARVAHQRRHRPG